MYATLLSDSRFHELLLVIDGDLAEAARVQGCACGGRLHLARYPRKPRGRPKSMSLGPEHDRRFSFCCSVDGCRGRLTPPSVRFLGRRIFIAAVVVLAAIVREGITDGRLGRLSQVVRVDRRTVERWRRWWRQTFTQSPFWQAGRAAFMPPVDPNRLPAAVMERFAGDAASRLVALLRFLSSARLDSHILLTVVLAGDGRLLERLRSDELMPLNSRMRVRLALERATPDELAELLAHALQKAGAVKLMTPDLITTLADHAQGNP